jgi:hypothetical protein
MLTAVRIWVGGDVVAGEAEAGISCPSAEPTSSDIQGSQECPPTQ